MESNTTINIGNRFKQLLGGSIDQLIQKLLAGINRETIFCELTTNSAFLQNGTFGIAWIYNQLFQLKGEDYCQIESLFWSNSSFEFDETNQGLAGFNVLKENEVIAFRLLVGLTGINFVKL